MVINSFDTFDLYSTLLSFCLQHNNYTPYLGIQWGEPISEAEKIRARLLNNKKEFSKETKINIQEGLESEGYKAEGRALAGTVHRWPNALVPYRVDAAFDMKEREIIATVKNLLRSLTLIWLAIYTN